MNNSRDEVAISVKNVSKDFVLPHHQNRSIKGAVTTLLKRKDKGIDIQHALSDVSFDIKKGEFFGILGRNGSGKSTLLKMLANIYTPTNGSIETKGKLVPFIELGVGFNPELTGRENVFLNGALLGFTKDEVEAQYDDIVAFAELEDFMDQKLKNYSSGMQVRLAFSVATRAKADILLIDEVLAVGDADFQRKCFNFFRSLKKSGTTVVFVSHDMGAVRTFCDRAVLIEKSKKIAEGRADDIATKYSRMFVEPEDDKHNDEEDLSDLKASGKRFGNNKVTLSEPILSKTTITEGDDTLTVSYAITVKQPVEDLVVGIGIEDIAGHQICGTNTLLKNIRISDLKAGDKHSFTWTFPNIFADGKHLVNITAHSNDGVSFYDWWENAAVFDVKKTEKTSYPVTPNITVTKA